MMSKTSSNKVKSALHLMNFTLRKDRGLLVLCCIVTLLFCPGYLITVIRGAIQNNIGQALDPADFLTPVTGFMTFASSALVILLNGIHFSYLFSRRSDDMFHALPLTRKGLFFARLCAGLIFVLIPMVLCYGSFVVLTAVYPQIRACAPMIPVTFCYNLMTVLISSTVSAVFILCAGTAFDMLLSMGGVCIGAIIISAIISSFAKDFLYGFVSEIEFSRICQVLSPFAYCLISLSDYLESMPAFTVRDACFFVISAAETAALLTLSAFLVKYRPAERAGASYAFSFMRLLCGFVLSVIGGFVLGIIFADGEVGGTVFWIFVPVGALLTAVAYGAICDRGFRHFKRALPVGIAATLALIAIMVTACTGAFGFTQRVPAKCDIESVRCHFQMVDFEFDDPETVLELHRAILSDRKQISDGNDVDDCELIALTYTLRDGRTLWREFEIPANRLRKERLAVHTDRQRIDAMKKAIDPKDPPNEIALYLKTYDAAKEDDPVYRNSFSLTVGEAQRLLDAYIADLPDATEKSFAAWDDPDLLHAELELSKLGENEYLRETRTEYLCIEPTFERTLACLEEMKLAERITEE